MSAPQEQTQQEKKYMLYTDFLAHLSSVKLLFGMTDEEVREVLEKLILNFTPKK